MPLPRYNLPSVPLPSTHLLTLISQHHPGSMLAPVASFSAPSGKSSALPLAPHTLHVSAVLLGPGNHSLGSGARCFWGQAGTKWRGRWVEDCGKTVLFEGLCNLHSRAWRRSVQAQMLWVCTSAPTHTGYKRLPAGHVSF